MSNATALRALSSLFFAVGSLGLAMIVLVVHALARDGGALDLYEVVLRSTPGWMLAASGYFVGTVMYVGGCVVSALARPVCADTFVQGGPEGAQGGIGGSDDDAPCTNENGPEPHK